MTQAKRWLAFETQYEPNFESKRWGSRCICFEFTDRDADSGDFEINPCVAYHSEAIADAEEGGRELSPLWTYDQGYRTVLQLMSEQRTTNTT